MSLFYICTLYLLICLLFISSLSDNFLSVKNSFQDVYLSKNTEFVLITKLIFVQDSPLLDKSLPMLAGTIILNVLSSG